MNRIIAYIAFLTVLLPIEAARAVAPVVFDEKLPTIDKVMEGDSSVNRSVDAHGLVHYRICMVGKISPGGVVEGHVDVAALCLSDEAGSPILMAPIVISHVDSEGRPDENARSIGFSLSKQLEKRAVLNLRISNVMRVRFFAFRLPPPKVESPEPSAPPKQ